MKWWRSIRLVNWGERNPSSSEQLRAAHAQNAFNCSEYEKQIALLLHDLAEAKYELARRDARDALAGAPSPSEMTH